MGMPTCYSDIVPFVFSGFCCGDNRKDVCLLPVLQVLDPQQVDTTRIVKRTVFNGWQVKTATHWTRCFTYGKRRKLTLDVKLVKDGFVVYPINQHQYESVDCYDYAVMSNDRQALKMFIKEVLKPLIPNIHRPVIKADAIVQQWI